MHGSVSVDIDRPIGEVFILTNDHVVAWSSMVVEDRPIHLAPDGGVGTTFQIVTEDRGSRMEFMGEVLEYDPPRRSAISMRGQMFDLHAAYDFEDLGQGRTRVTQTSSSRGKGIWRLFLLVLGPLMRKSATKATERELNGLRVYCESGTPATPGGPA